MNELALFAGAGGGILAGKLLGWNTVAAVEIEEYPRQVLLQRQRDRILPQFPIWDDVQTFDGKPWKGLVDIITGGFPCQDVSSAGKGMGVRNGSRSGLWKEFARIIEEVQPSFVFAENSPLLVTRGLDIILTDLAKLGYGARWGVLGAWHLGGTHQRDRIWILAHRSELLRLSSHHNKRGSRKGGSQIPKSGNHCSQKVRVGCSWKGSQPPILRMDDGVSDRVDRIGAIGNGQVPIVAAAAFILLSEGLIQ